MTRNDHQLICTGLAYAVVMMTSCDLILKHGDELKLTGTDDKVAKLAKAIDAFCQENVEKIFAQSSTNGADQ
jgi:hypothetical protein